ncbi:MAG: YIP1 family protein [Nanoarchaeota archaeon]|nr:YIP1 family protein [Nanoarchaeota archaeon]
MDIFQVIKRVVTEPTAFFRNVGKGKEHLRFAFGYFALLSLVQTLLGLLVGILLLPAFRFWAETVMPMLGSVYGPLGTFSVGWIMGNAVFTYILGLGLSFLFAGLLHLWILIFRGKNSYVKTYELGAYAGTPAMLLGWIPFFSFIGIIWYLILLIIGTQEVHGISRTKAILMYVIPVAVIFLLALLAMIFFFLAFGSVLGSMMGGLSY